MYLTFVRCEKEMVNVESQVERDSVLTQLILVREHTGLQLVKRRLDTIRSPTPLVSFEWFDGIHVCQGPPPRGHGMPVGLCASATG